MDELKLSRYYGSDSYITHFQGDKVLLEQGYSNRELKLASLRYLYVRKDYRTATGKRVNTMLLTYEAEDGNTRVIRCFSNIKDSGFNKIVKAFLERRPDIDIRSLPLKEALAKMGAIDRVKAGRIFLLTSLPTIFIFPLVPLLYRGTSGGLKYDFLDKLLVVGLFAIQITYNIIQSYKERHK